MSPLTVPWWLFWLLASATLYTSLMVFFVREATRFGQDRTTQPSAPDAEVGADAADEPSGGPRTKPVVGAEDGTAHEQPARGPAES